MDEATKTGLFTLAGAGVGGVFGTVGTYLAAVAGAKRRERDELLESTRLVANEFRRNDLTLMAALRGLHDDPGDPARVPERLETAAWETHQAVLARRLLPYRWEAVSSAGSSCVSHGETRERVLALGDPSVMAEIMEEHRRALTKAAEALYGAQERRLFSRDL